MVVLYQGKPQKFTSFIINCQCHLCKLETRYSKTILFSMEKFSAWCSVMRCDHFNITGETLVSFLSFLVHLKKSYRVVNTHKTVIIQTSKLFGISWCSSTVMVARFMRGPINRSPPKVRYSFTWEVKVVLDVSRSWSPLNSLSLKLLTSKLVALIALACAPRAQTLIALSTSNFQAFHEKV